MIGEYHLKLEAQTFKTYIHEIIFFSTQKGPWKQFRVYSFKSWYIAMLTYCIYTSFKWCVMANSVFPVMRDGPKKGNVMRHPVTLFHFTMLLPLNIVSTPPVCKPHPQPTIPGFALWQRSKKISFSFFLAKTLVDKTKSLYFTSPLT